jgi:hypothetical protein
MIYYSDVDWWGARKIERVFKEIQKETGINAWEFLDAVPDLIYDRPLKLFIIAQQMGISVDWLKKRYATQNPTSSKVL